MNLSDRDVFRRMADAEKEYLRWEGEYKRRGLDKIPYVQYSTLPKGTKEENSDEAE